MITIRAGNGAIGICLLLLVTGCSREQQDWRSAEAADTIDGYGQFIQRHPESELVTQARTRVTQLGEDRDWQRAGSADTVGAYRDFLSQHPNGKWAQEARIRIENFSLGEQTGTDAASRGAAGAGGAAATNPYTGGVRGLAAPGEAAVPTGRPGGTGGGSMTRSGGAMGGAGGAMAGAGGAMAGPGGAMAGPGGAMAGAGGAMAGAGGGMAGAGGATAGPGGAMAGAGGAMAGPGGTQRASGNGSGSVATAGGPPAGPSRASQSPGGSGAPGDAKRSWGSALASGTGPASTGAVGTRASSFGIQLGAFSSEAAANNEWRLLTGRFGPELQGLQPHVVTADTPSGRVYRLQAMVGDEARARGICDSLRKRSQGCVAVLPH